MPAAIDTQRGSFSQGPVTTAPFPLTCSNARKTRRALAALKDGTTIDWGSWAALDLKGNILWQIPDPTEGAIDIASLSVANGVMYAGSYSGYMYAIEAATGRILWSFNSGGSVIDGPSIVNGTLFWGSGYRKIAPGIGNNKVFAFTVP
jgi:polyvinyl alcohol dehydrogenase (cytochrome)